MSRADAQVANEGKLIHMEDGTAHKEITGEVFHLQRFSAPPPQFLGMFTINYKKR